MARHQKLKSKGGVSDIGVGLAIMLSPVLLLIWLASCIFGEGAILPALVIGIVVLDVLLTGKGD